MTEKASKSVIIEVFPVKKLINISKNEGFVSNDLGNLGQQDGCVGAAVDIQLF